MSESIESILKRAISPAEVVKSERSRDLVPMAFTSFPQMQVQPDAFDLEIIIIRMRELQREFDRCTRIHLFLSRSDAKEVARLLNANEAS